MDWQPFNMFQNRNFAEIYSRYRDTELYNVRGNTGFIFKIPLLGYIKLRIYLKNTADIKESLREAINTCYSKGIPQLEVVTSVKDDDLFSKYSTTQDGTYVIDLQSNIEDLWKKVQKRTRESIRQSKRKGVSITQTGGLDDFKAWWSIYSLTGQRGEFLTQKYDLIEEIFKNRDISQLFVAKLDGEIIAGALLIINDYPLYWLGGSNEKFWKFNPNQLLHWEIVEWSKTNNYPFYDMGGAIKDAETGPSRFKKHFGGEFKEIYTHHKNLDSMKSKLINLGINLRYRLVRTV